MFARLLLMLEPPALAQVTPMGPAEIPAACVTPPPPHPLTPPVPLYERLLPILVLIGVIALVVSRLPKVDLGHSPAFRRRRVLNWLPLGLTYSLLYFARYNLNPFMQAHGITEAQFGSIFAWGSLTYGLSFVLNGPLTDFLGGRRTILLAAAGAAAANVAIGYMVLTGEDFGDRVRALTLLYCANMYFQSFGAVSIVKVNAAWFHLRERGTFGGIFGILISLGLFFAFDGGRMITDSLSTEWLFFIPAILLGVFFVLSLLFVRDTPADAGLQSFDPGDATSLHDGVSRGKVILRIVTNPIILIIAAIEMCSGFLRQAIMEWGQNFGKGIGLADHFVIKNWGVVSAIAGILGGMFAGTISDHLFQSRRLPVSAVLYMIMLGGAIAIVPLFSEPSAIPWVLAFMSLAIIGVHGMLSGTASADFGGIKSAGIAVGIIDGFVYLGSSIQSWIYGSALPAAKVTCPDGKTQVANPAVKLVENWHVWPYGMIPVALLGLVLAIILWNARPQPKKR